MTSVLQALKTSHHVTERVYTVTPGISVRQAAILMREMNIGSLPVLDNGEVVGIITERDITFKLVTEGVDPATVIVAEYMTPDPLCVPPEMEVTDCLNLMKEKRIRHVPVLEKNRLIGLISMRDVLHTVLRDNELLAQQFEAYIIGNR